jgi:hypothetical protein
MTGFLEMAELHAFGEFLEIDNHLGVMSSEEQRA